MDTDTESYKYYITTVHNTFFLLCSAQPVDAAHVIWVVHCKIELELYRTYIYIYIYYGFFKRVSMGVIFRLFIEPNKCS